MLTSYQPSAISRQQADRVMHLPVRSYIGAPSDRMPGLTADVLAAPLRQTAFIELHCWNVGFPDGPAYPNEYFVDMGSPACTTLGEQIVVERIKPALEAARAADMAVFHVQPENIARKHPQSQYLLEPRLPGPAMPPAAIPGYGQARADRVHGPGYRDWEGWDTMDIPRVVYPLPDDGVIITGAQFDRILRERGITNLIYTGFATNMCILDSAAAMKEMQRYGYRCILLRDCTLAVEFPDTFDDLLNTRVAVRYIETWVGATATLDDFLTAARTA